jgi:CubicO group peptidase (beta-lactamase class C family)
MTFQSNLASRLDAAVEKAIAEKRIVGAVVLVAQNGKIAYRGAAGLADRERAVPMNEDVVFRLSSVTKPIVAATIMRLVEQGTLDLSDPVTRWLPDFHPRLPNGDEPMLSVRHLLTHTAGLSYGFLEAEGGPYHRLKVSDGLDQPGLSMEENLRRLAAAPLLFAPGEAWHYSLGMDVLGAVAAKAAGVSLPELVGELVLNPLGMRDTAFRVVDPSRLAAPYVDAKPEPALMRDGMLAPLTNIPNLPEGAAVRFEPSRAFDLTSYPSGGAGMNGTAPDFLRFLEAIRSGGAPILKSETIAQMTADQVGTQAQTQGPGWGFGYGWAVLVDPTGTGTPQSPGTYRWGGVYGHSWFVDPVKALSVVAFTNTACEGMNGGFVGEIRDAVYG